MKHLNLTAMKSTIFSFFFGLLLFNPFFSEAYPPLEPYEPNTHFNECRITEQNGKYGISLGNQLVVPCEYDEIFPQHTTFFKVRKNRKYGLIHYYYSKNKRNICHTACHIVPFRKGYVTLQPTLACEYDEISDYRDNFLHITRGHQTGILNYYGSVVIPCRYEKAELQDNHFWVEAQGKQGIYNRYGSVIIPVRYTAIEETSEYYLVEQGKLKGIINRYGSVLIPCRYTLVRNEGKSFYVEDNGQCGIYNLYGSVVIPCRFDEIRRIDKRYFVRQNKSYGVYNQYGSVVLPCRFSKIECLANGQLVASSQGKWQLYNAYGSLLGEYGDSEVIYSTEETTD